MIRRPTIPARRVILEGELGDKFGREWLLHCSTAAQAIALIRCNRPGLTQYLAKSETGFVVTIAGQAVTAERLLGPFARTEELVIMPAPIAAGSNDKGVWTIVAGIVLIAISAFIPVAAGGAAGLFGTGVGATGVAGFVGNLGLALVFSGASALIAGQPDFSNPSERKQENEASYLMDGPGNRTRQGHARALIYGAVIVGGQPVSLGISNEEWVDAKEADIGTIDGNGYADSARTIAAGDLDSFDANLRQSGWSTNEYGGWTIQASGGGGKGGEEQKQAVEAPDSYRSVSYVKVQDLLGEGEIYGPLDAAFNLITSHNRLSTAIFLDKTPIQNEDGTFNFKNVKLWLQPGTPSQKWVPGFDGTETENSIGTEVVAATPVIFTVTDATVDAVRVTIRFPQMYKRNLKNGNVDGSSVNFKVEIEYDSGGYGEVMDRTVRQKNMNPVLRSYRFDLDPFVTDAKIKVTRVTPDETGSHIQNRIFFNSLTEIQDEHLNHPNSAKLSGDMDATQFNRVPVRAIRLGGLKVQIPDNYDPIEKTYAGSWGGAFDVGWTNNPAWIFLDILTQTRYGLGRWVALANVDTAALYTIAQACDELVTMGITKSVELVASFVTSATSVVVQIPQTWIEDGDTIEFPTTTVTVDGKVRKGARDAVMTSGSLIVGADYIINDVSGSADFTGVGAEANTVGMAFTATGTTPTWGTGELQPVYYTMTVDATPGGEAAAGVVGTYTGKEPRFECNVVIQAQEDAYKVLTDLASAFRGMAYWGGGQFVAVQDVAKDAVHQFTEANVEGGFKTTTTSLKSRHTTAMVRYNEPEDFFDARSIYVEDPEGVFKWGVNEARLVAFGCTSESQAMRVGRFVLFTERLETEAVEFVAGIEGHKILVGDIVDTYDNRLATTVLAGRTKEVDLTTATLDRKVALTSGETYTVTFVKKDSSGLVSKTITAPTGTVETADITFDTLLVAELPAQNGPFLIQAASPTKKQWRVLAAKENKRGKNTIVGLAYKSEKFALIEALEREAKRELDDTLRRCLPASNLDVITEKISTDLGEERFATATWNASSDRHARSYLVTSRQGDSDWDPVQETFATTLRLPLKSPGVYEYQVIAKNSIGVQSGPVTTTFTLTEDGLVIGTTDPPQIDPKGGVKPDGVDLDDVRMLNEEGESEVRYTVTEEEQITSGTPTSGQDYEIIDSTTSGEVLTAGATTNLREYRIKDNGGGLSDFTGVGAADNNEGTIFTANGGTPDYTGGGVLSQSNNSDFELAGAADSSIGTTFEANGTAPYWGTDGELRKITDTDPLTTSETVSTFNPNWLIQSNNWQNAAWTKVNGIVTDEGVNSDPDGGKNADQIEPSGVPKRIEVYQEITPPNLYKGQYWTASVHERVTNETFGQLKFEITESGGAEPSATTSFEFVPTPGAWSLRQIQHQIQQTDRTTLRFTISAENATNPNDKFLFLYKAQFETGRQRTKGVINTTTAGGNFTVPSYAGTTTVRARTFITEEVFSAMVEESYDFDDGAAIVAEPDLRPFGGKKYEGLEFPLTVTIEQLEPSATTKYTTDGSDPTAGTTYSAPFEVSSGDEVRAISSKTSFTDSSERVEEYEQGF